MINKTSFGAYFDDQRDRMIKAMQNKNTQQNNEWRYGKFNFVVEGINIELLRDDAVCAATTYGNEQIIPVLRVKGENIKTRITIYD